MSPVASDHVLMLTKARLAHSSMTTDPLVVASFAAPYTMMPAALAKAFASVSSALGIGPNWPIGVFLLGLWAAQILLMSRLALSATGRRDAAGLATLFFAFDMPIFVPDIPYNITYFERSLGMVPFLYAFWALLERRMTSAWAALVASIYLHASPGLYFMPLFAVEELRLAWQNPSSRTSSALRLIGGAAALLPLFLRVALNAVPASELSYYRMNMRFHSVSSGGVDMRMADHVFRLEGLVLMALAFYRARGLRSRAQLLRMSAVGLVLIGWGTLSYFLFAHGLLACGIFVKMHLWKSLALLEFPALLALSAWLAEESDRPGALASWPGMLLILALSSYRDFVARLAGIGVGICLVAGAGAAGQTVLAALAVAPLIHLCVPGIMHALVLKLGLHGGLFLLPAFKLWIGASVLLALGLGWLLRRLALARAQPSRALLLGVAAFVFVSASIERRLSMPEKQELHHMASWIKTHTPPDAMILVSPVDLVGSCKDFVLESERSAFPCMNYYESAAMYGALAGPMAERMRAVKFDFDRATDNAAFRAETKRAYESLSPAEVESVARRYKTGYFLARDDRRWPWNAVFREGDAVLFQLGR